MHAESMRRAVPMRGGAGWALLALLLVVLPVLPGAGRVEAAQDPLLAEALRSLDGGEARPVTLPDIAEAASRGTIVRARYRVGADLGARPRPQALYASGLVGRARISLNGAVLVDEIADPLPPAPRGLALLRLLDLPGALLRPGVNVIEIELAGRGAVSLSALRIGEREALAALRDRKALLMVIGPLVVAAVMGSLGLSMLVLYLRLRSEALYGYFAAGAVLWALHTAWTVAPQRLLTGTHQDVWWNSLYAVFVVMLVLFCLRFGQRSRRWIERALLGAVLATPALLYGAAALGALGPAAEALRLGLVVLAASALGAVAHRAWHRRRLDSALLVFAGLVGAGFGLRDWLVFHGGDDNLPVALTPYAGLPFILLVSALLIERFVRTTRALGRLNRDLDARVARREAELAANYERLGALERAQAASGERQRIMRELHDGLGAKLVAAQLRIDRAELDREGLSRELRACLTDMRLATEALTPGEAELGALIGNFLFRWEGLLRDAGVRAAWQVELPAAGQHVPPYVALQLLRVMQEALSNVLRHADAHRVQLRLAHDGRALVLAIEDDGRGIAPGGAAAGRGLPDMRSRAGAIGARFVLEAPPGGGTRVGLHLPWPD
jgi:signal transduction histidine kinase